MDRWLSVAGILVCLLAVSTPAAAQFTLDKQLSTGLAATNGNDVAIGETVTFTVTIDVPDGAAGEAVTLSETLPSGMAFASFGSITASPELSTDAAGGFAGAFTNRVMQLSNQQVVFDLGMVENADGDPGTAQTIVLVYTAVITNAAGNQRGTTLTDALSLAAGADTPQADTQFTVVEPRVTVSLAVTPTSADPSTTVQHTLTIEAPSESNASPAHDVIVTLPVPSEFDDGTVVFLTQTGVMPDTRSYGAGVWTLTFAALTPGQSSVLRFSATLRSTSPVPAPGSQIGLTPAATWTSLPGDVTTTQSPYHAAATERTGNTGNPGASVNDYTSTGTTRSITIYSSSLSGTVYIDRDGSGTLSAGDAGIEDVTMQLTGTDHLGNSVNTSTTTDADGEYAFTGRRPGTYTLTEVQPAGYRNGRVTHPSGTLIGHAIHNVTLSMGQNNTYVANFGEFAVANLSMSGRGGSVGPGGDVSTIWTVKNDGPSVAENVTVAMPPPHGLTFESLIAAGWSCNAPIVGQAGRVECSTASIAAGASIDVGYTAKGASDLPIGSTLNAVATIVSDTPSDRLPDVGEARLFVVPPGSADLEISLNRSAINVAPSTSVPVVIAIRNRGPEMADPFTVTVDVPAMMSIQGASGSVAADCGPANQSPVICDFSDPLPVGETVTLTVNLTAQTAATGTLTATVDDATSPDPSGHAVSVPVTVTNAGGADIEVTSRGPAVATGPATVTITHTITNHGPLGVAAVELTASGAPPGVTFLRHEGACSSSNACVTGGLSAGQTVTVSTIYLADAGAAAAVPLFEHALYALPQGQADPNNANNLAMANFLIVPSTIADIGVVSVDSPDAAVAGREFGQTVIVYNQGPAAAAGVSLSHALPAGATLLSASPSQGNCTMSAPATCALGTVPSGGFATISFVAGSVAARPPSGEVQTTSIVGTSTTDALSNNNGTIETTTMIAVADLEITKSSTPPVTAGTSLAYTITVTNDGPSDAENVVVSDSTPAGLSFTSNTGDCTSSFPCNLGTILVGGSRTITSTYAVPSSYTTPAPIVSGTATVTSDASDPDTANNSASDSTALTFESDLSPSLSGSTVATPGGTASYTVTVTNHGPSDAAGGELNVTVPAGLTFSSSPECPGGFPCFLAPLANGASTTVGVTYALSPAYSMPDPIEVTAAISPYGTPDSNPTNDTAQHFTALGPPSADLSVTSAAPPTAVQGTDLVFTLVVTNDGPSDASGVMLAATAPIELTFVGNSGDCATAFPCAIGMVPAGQSRTVTATYHIPDGYTTPDPIVHTVNVTATTDDPDTTDNQATSSVATSTDIRLTKTVDDSTPNVGDEITFTITAVNDGPSNATGLSVTDAWPAGLELLEATPSQGSHDPVSGLWTIGSLANGASATLQLRAKVNVAGLVTNTVTKTAGDQADPDASNNTAAVTLTPNPTADVRVQMQADVTSVNTGSLVTFTILAANAGPSDATGVRIVDQLPQGLTFAGAVMTAGTFDQATGTWELATLASGAQATLTLQAIVDAGGPLLNTAQKTAQNEYDPNPANDATGATVNGLSADIQVVKTVSTSTAPAVGEYATFFITATNNGPSAATGLRIRDALPAGLGFVSATASRGVYVAATGVWELGDLAATGADATATLELQVVIKTAGAIVNSAPVLEADQPDPNPLNNSSSAETQAVSSKLTPAISIAGDINTPGAVVDLGISVTNTGAAASTAPMMLIVPLPAEHNYMPTSSMASVSTRQTAGAAGWSCTLVGRTVFCSSESALASGEQASAIVRASVQAAPAAGRAIFVHTATPGQPGAALGIAQTYLGAPPPPNGDVAVSQTVSVSSNGGASRTLTYSVAVSNQGSAPASDVVLTDVIAAPIALASATGPSGSCATSGGYVSCTLGTILPGRTAYATIVLTAPVLATVTHAVQVSAGQFDVDLANNRSVLVEHSGIAEDTDTDSDGMTDAWESAMGLSVLTADANGDADHDGVSNLEEYQRGTHPNATERRYFAEGVINPFFDTRLAVLNPDPAASASVLIELLREDGSIVSVPRLLAPLGRFELEPKTVLTGGGSFSVLVESERPVAAERDMRWDASGYGSTGESGSAAASPTWYFAEGSTLPYQLFFLIQNPSMTDTATLEMMFLLPDGRPPVTVTDSVAPHSRKTVYVNELSNDYAGLRDTSVAATITATNSVPIVVERAMYLDTRTQVLGAGHAGLGATSPSASWFFAEGATGTFFQEYITLANPQAAPAVATVRYLLPGGDSFEKAYELLPLSRLTIDVANEDTRLASTSVSATVTATHPIVAERVMWWPGRSISPEWYETHVSLGATATGLVWAIAGGTDGGPGGDQTYALIANQEARPGQTQVTVTFDDGTTIARPLELPPTSRTTLDFASLFPEARQRRFSAVIESTGGTPVPIVVEWSRYASPGGLLWSAGSAALATKVR